MFSRLVSILLTTLLLCVPQVQAMVFITPEAMTAGAIASLIEDHVRNHQGELPASWSDLGKPALERIEEGLRYTAPTKRYAFLDSSVRLPYPHEGRMVALMRRATYDRTGDLNSLWTPGLRGPGRYAVYLTDDIHAERCWLAEDVIQSIFASAHQSLTLPDSEPERKWITDAWHGIWLWRLSIIVAPLLLAWYVIRRWRARLQ